MIIAAKYVGRVERGALGDGLVDLLTKEFKDGVLILLADLGPGQNV